MCGNELRVDLPHIILNNNIFILKIIIIIKTNLYWYFY